MTGMGSHEFEFEFEWKWKGQRRTRESNSFQPDSQLEESNSSNSTLNSTRVTPVSSPPCAVPAVAVAAPLARVTRGAGLP